MTIPLAIAIAIIQSAVTSQLRVFGISLDLMLLFSVSWVLLLGLKDGILIVAAGSIVLDALSGAPFGLMTLSLTCSSFLAGLGEINVFRTAWYLPYVTIIIATLIYNVLFLFLLQTAGHIVHWGAMLWHVVLPTVVLNALCMPIIYSLTRWLYQRNRPKPVEWQ